MFADPQSVTIDATPVSLPRVSVGNREGVYESADGAYTLTIRHSNTKRARSMVRLDHRKVGPDALNPATNKQFVSSAWFVVDYPFTGVSDADQTLDIDALLTLISDPGFIAKFLGQES